MKLREFLDKVKDLPPDTRLCAAEINEALAMNVARIEVLDHAKAQSEYADGRERIELANGNEKVVVIRW
jgi:hypothetical protein